MELRFERERLGVAHMCIQATGAGGVDHARAAIDADHLTARFGQLLGQRAIAAAEIENAFAGIRREQIEQRGAEVGDEAGVEGVGIGVPEVVHGVCLCDVSKSLFRCR